MDLHNKSQTCKFLRANFKYYPASGKFLGHSLVKRCHVKAEYVPYLPSAKEYLGVRFEIQRDKFDTQPVKGNVTNNDLRFADATGNSRTDR